MNKFFVKMELSQVEVLYDRVVREIKSFMKKSKELMLNVSLPVIEKDTESLINSFLTS